ncbi:MAG: twin-arginine translocase TatA/TatE family subunit [Crocinitomicaceae bacterium]|jgi:sec-independent protein translocase protein TatA|nr:twin-arginine translocase TatA/TatE family subunit [Crocinitomicaceae bacterium]
MENIHQAGWFGPTEIIIILVIVLLFFGGRKIPELMKGLGKGVKEFKDASKTGEGENEEVLNDNEKIETK